MGKSLTALALCASLVSGCNEPRKTVMPEKYIDLNGDGKPDIVEVVMNPNHKKFGRIAMIEHNIIISLSQSNGAYSDQVIPLDYKPLKVDFQDLNNNGIGLVVLVPAPDPSFFGNINFATHELRYYQQDKNHTFSTNFTVIKKYSSKPSEY